MTDNKDIRSTYSVIIVGGGPTGLVLANLLGKSGVSTLLVEANAATVSEPRAVSIDDESLRVVQQVGLIGEVCSEIVSGYGSEYLGPDGRQFLKVKPLAKPYGHPRRNAFRQPVFEAQMRDGLGRWDCVDTLFECRVASFEERADTVLAKLDFANGRSIDVEASFLVGCDGSWSSTREAIGSTLAGSSLNEKWLIVDLEDCPSASPETMVFCDPARPGIMLPGPRNTRRYEFKLLPGEDPDVVFSDEGVAALLAAHGPVPGSRVVRRTVYHFHARIADCWGRGRVWLAGDAAHLMPPFAGQGMNGGIRDAANLAWKLTMVVKGLIGPGLLATYEQERRTHIGLMIQLALRMGSIFGPETRLKGWLTRTAFRVMSVWPAAKAYFAEMKYKPAPRFERGFFLDQQLSRNGLVGRMMPQPTLSSHGGVMLDDLLGEGFALIAVDLPSGFVNNLVKNASWPGVYWDACIDRKIEVSTKDAPELAAYSGQVLLVRPDRYVVAAISVAQADDVFRQLRKLMQSTWPDRDSHKSGRANSAEAPSLSENHDSAWVFSRSPA